jgi:predicted dehydrogenase
MIRIGVIGAGHWGPNLIRNFHNHKGSEVVFVADRDAARIARVREAYPDLVVCSSAEPVLTDPRVDAVVIATPTSTHFDLARAALEAGKHVLVEKPMTADVGEAEALCALAEKAHRVLMVGHVFLYNKAVQRARKYLADGELGHLYYLSMVRTNLGPIRMDVNAAWDLAAHDVSIANYWLGGAPVTVTAAGGSWINAGLQDAVFATLRWRDGVLANLHTSWLHPRKVREIAAVGDRKMLTFDDMNPMEPLRLYDRQVTDEVTQQAFVDSFTSFRASIREGDVLIPKVQTGEPLKNECDEFVACAADGRAPLSGAREGLAVVRVLAAIDRSMRDGGCEMTVDAG